MSGRDRPRSDFIYVECQNFAGFRTYSNFHAFAQRNETVRRFRVSKKGCYGGNAITSLLGAWFKIYIQTGNH